MANNEILKTDLLDIIFENRNKDYGAYALRKEYNHRLLRAIGIVFSIILFFILIHIFRPKKAAVIAQSKMDNGIVLKTVILPPNEPKLPQTVKPQKPEPVATVKSISRIVIRPDNEVPRTTVPTLESLIGKVIGSENLEGKPEELVAKPAVQLTLIPGDGVKKTVPEPPLPTSEPEFPGGAAALRKFLAENLTPPEDLEINEKKMVHIRFKVDMDGKVSELDIITSGGKSFDREVIRVCKLMPRWKPALQNGIRVPVSYILPVTFIGVEQ